jgi:hypothetical protein
MERGTVSKMGAQLLVNVNGMGFKRDELLMLKPRGIDERLYKRVSKQGKDRMVVIIPKGYHQFFEQGCTVYIESMKVKK